MKLPKDTPDVYTQADVDRAKKKKLKKKAAAQKSKK